MFNVPYQLERKQFNCILMCKTSFSLIKTIKVNNCLLELLTCIVYTRAHTHTGVGVVLYFPCCSAFKRKANKRQTIYQSGGVFLPAPSSLPVCLTSSPPPPFLLTHLTRAPISFSFFFFLLLSDISVMMLSLSSSPQG